MLRWTATEKTRAHHALLAVAIALAAPAALGQEGAAPTGEAQDAEEAEPAPAPEGDTAPAGEEPASDDEGAESGTTTDEGAEPGSPDDSAAGSSEQPAPPAEGGSEEAAPADEGAPAGEEDLTAPPGDDLAAPPEDDLTAPPEDDLTAPPDDLTAPPDDLTAAPDGEGEDDFLDLDVTQSDEPSVLERQIVAVVASGVTLAALGAGIAFGTLAYIQFQCVSDVLTCNENLSEPIVGDQLFDARANVEHLALLADMAYLFAAASALVAVTGFIRGFLWTGEDEAVPAADEEGFFEAEPAEPEPMDQGEVMPGEEVVPDEGAPEGEEGAGSAPPPPPQSADASLLRGSLHFEVE